MHVPAESVHVNRSDYMKRETSDWLLDQSNPSVRFWTLQQVLGKRQNDPEVMRAQAEVMRSDEVTRILKAQRPEGHWEKSEDMYRPKYTATTHTLLILAELGAAREPQIERAVEHIFRFQRVSGHFLIQLPKTQRAKESVVKDGCCIDGNILYYLVHFGYLDDPHTQQLIQFQVDYHSDDVSGWKCRSYPIDPSKVFPENCYMGRIKVLRAFARIPKSKRSSDLQRIINQEVETVLDNGIFRYLRNTDGSRKDKQGWKRFGFPLFYQSDALEVLDVLTELGVRDERMGDAIELTLSQMSDKGTWALKNSYNGKMWIAIEEQGKPSKWITLRAIRVLDRYFGNTPS